MVVQLHISDVCMLFARLFFQKHCQHINIVGSQHTNIYSCVSLSDVMLGRNTNFHCAAKNILHMKHDQHGSTASFLIVQECYVWVQI